MLIKIAGKPIDLAVEVKDINFGIVKDAYHVASSSIKEGHHLIHTPINMDITYGGKHLINGDVNVFNIPKYIYANVGHHLTDLF